MNLFVKKIQVNDLSKILDSYMPKNQIKLVKKAYYVSEKAHYGQYRHSGESYVSHPLSVAIILAELKLDYFCIIAALLHDCIEDTSLTQDDIVKDFGDEVAHIVQGVSKLTDLEFHTNIDKQAQNFRKLFLAMSTDMRVMMIKLADRLHNMRTLKSVDIKKQLKIAKETSEIHAPIARRLGLNSIRAELEDLCFQVIHPYRYKVITKKIKKQYGNSKKNLNLIHNEIENRLKQEKIYEVKIIGRGKQPYSIYKKMQLKQLKFSRVLDMYAFRIIVKDASKCYQILGIIHNLYKPLPGRFKDYIALPKSNGYQSLHSILFGPNKILIEVQIRSEDMDFMSEYGIAAHWHYKSEDNTPANLASNWLGSLLEIQQRSGNSKDFLEDTKNDLFPSEVFVFTPQGDIVQLPYGATVLDFAYAIHTKIGNHMIKAKIDKRKASFAEKLKSGQTIEIFTHKKSKPDPSWLKIAMTAKAKSSIKTKLKENSSAELIQLGKFLVQNAIDYHADSFKIDRQAWENCLKDLKCNNKSELYIKIALSEILVSVVLNKLVLKDNDAPLVKSIVINKTQEKAISFANCCYPVPGDKVASILTTNKGLVLHRVICSNLIRAKQKNEQWLDVDWRPDYSEEFKTSIRVYVENRRGMLASIVNVISKIGINIENLEVEEKDNYVKAFKLLINVSGVNQLNQVLHNIKSLEYVASIERV